MKLYSKSLLVNILEARLLDTFEDYYPQGQYNNIFISYLYQYIRQNTWSGEHDQLLREFTNLTLTDPSFADMTVKENTDRQTYVLTKDSGFTSEMKSKIALIIKEYYNYSYKVDSSNRIEVQVKFGWLPPNAASWLNLLNDECIIDYYIDGTILRPNTHSTLGGKPDSGFVCFRVKGIKQYDTAMFLYNEDKMNLNKDEPIPIFTVASLLNELEGSKGATLNRIVDFELDNFFYEIGPYARNYLTAQESSIIIQVPWELAVGEYFYLFDVTNAVKIADNNNVDVNHQDNYFVTFNNPNFDNMFTKYKLKDKKALVDKIINNEETLNDTLIRFLLGDFIWKTSDSKLIAFAQNIINALFVNSQLTPNGVWSDNMSSLVARYKTNSGDSSIFDDDVIDKQTEIAMLSKYKIIQKLDPNEELWNEW